MSRKLKSGLVAVALLIALGWVSALRFNKRQPLAGGASSTPGAASSPIADSAPSRLDSPNPTPTRPAPALIRCDANFWPQIPHPVALRRRTLVPSRSLEAGQLLDNTARVWLAQFGGPLSDENKAALKKDYGIEALSPSVAMCFYVRARAADLALAADAFQPSILGWARLEPADKILDAAFSRESPQLQLRVSLYPAGNLRAATQRAEALGGKILKQGTNWFETELVVQASSLHDGEQAGSPHHNSRALALALGELDDVYMIEPARPKYTLHNVDSENNSDATPLFSAPYNLTGAGITVMVRDEARIYAHPDFGTRLLFGPDVTGETPVQHSTHVAGTIGGDGSSIPGAGARGYAPGCKIVSYDLNGDESAEPLQAKQTFNATLSNHSYGFETGWDNGVFTDNQATFGLYSTFARNWDSLVRTQNLILVKSAGNSRSGSGPGHPHNGTLAADGEYYDTCDQSSMSKNVLIVGAVISSAVAGTPDTTQYVMSFSSSGPSDDGRLRPEIVADGDTVLSCDDTAADGSTYVALSGTSMAAAAVTGATTIFLQRYAQYFGAGNTFSPHGIRAVYAQTATDFGRPGPDYLHGFGMLDLSAAVALLDADHGTGQRLVTSSLDGSTGERFFQLVSDGTTPIKATLCWSDDPGDALATKSLVNDLDLRLVNANDQSATFPFTLNPAAPDQPAKPGINSVDTIEQVIYAVPPAGNYLLAVRGSTLISPTPFVIASSHSLTEVQPPVPSLVPSGTSGQPPYFVSFDGSGSTAAPGGSIVQYIWSFGDGNSAQGALVQHVYLTGVFTATLKVIDDKGVSASTSVVISVDNKPPNAVISASPPSGAPPLNVYFSSDGSADPDGIIQSFDWDFGDGTTGSGPGETHTYSAGGLYWATLTVTDNGGATNSKIASVLVGESFTPAAAHFGLNFIKSGKDSFTISTQHLPIAPNLSPGGLQGSIQFGMASTDFFLDYKGMFKSPNLYVKLVPLHAQMTIRLTLTNLQAALASSGVANITVKGQYVYVPFAVTFTNGLVFGSPGLKFKYSATHGKTGAGTYVKQ